MSDTSKTIISIARFLVALGAGVGLAVYWRSFRPFDEDLVGYGAGLVVFLIAYFLLTKLAHSGGGD